MAIMIGPAGLGGFFDFSDKLHARMKSYHDSGIRAVEIPFTYGVRMTEEQAQMLADINKDIGLSFSIHAPYFINLAALEESKVFASRKRILDSCSRAHDMGAGFVVFHAGFYLGRDKKVVYQKIRSEISMLMDAIRKNGWDVQLAPETTGKQTQFGDLDELLRLKQDTGCHLTVDFAHLLARGNGTLDLDDVFRKLTGIGHIHAHFSGIEWTLKGERRHLPTQDSDIIAILRKAIEYGVDMTLINESPEMIDDSLRALAILKEMTGPLG